MTWLAGLLAVLLGFLVLLAFVAFAPGAGSDLANPTVTAVLS